jgi:flagellar basal body-associated protein FliL
MADESTTTEQELTEAAPPKKLSIKLIGVIAIMMIAEGAGVYILVSMTSGSASSAMTIEGTEEAGREQTTEVLLIEDRFQNVSSGTVWLWDTSIYLQVRNKNTDRVEKVMKQREAEIKEGVAKIFRRAEDKHLRDDPGLETITRQLTAYLYDVFGTDRDDLPLIERIIIPKCTGINAGG